MMTSSQRIIEYTKIISEDQLDKEGKDIELKAANWPKSGEITFENVSMKYREGLEPAMNNLTLTI